MGEASTSRDRRLTEVDPARMEREPTPWDRGVYRRLISTELDEEQVERVLEPPRIYPNQREVLAVHWHPEYVPMELILQRYDKTFPSRTLDLVIPTQHNIFLTLDGYSGAEVDCHAREFNTKVQLLLHFSAGRLREADALKGMVAHTFKYRSSQLYDFIGTIVDPKLMPLFREAAARGAADERLLEFVRIQTRKFRELLETYREITPPEAIKNKLLTGYFDELRAVYVDNVIDRAQLVLRNVKKLVKRNFSLDYFFEVQEIIEETRALGGCIVVPHPEQFWPILLADYDLDGYEVWNPQSHQYTTFLVDVVNRLNRRRSRSERQLLIFMGDDTHLSTKVRDPRFVRPEKLGREVGVQPGWEDLEIRKSLSVGNFDRRRVIEEYTARLI